MDLEPSFSRGAVNNTKSNNKSLALFVDSAHPSYVQYQVVVERGEGEKEREVGKERGRAR